MLCSEKCPKKTDCIPLSNVIASDESSFVCVGLHGETKEEYQQDIYRHCFKSETTDSVFDYDAFDLKSVISVMSEALLWSEIMKNDQSDL